MAAVSPEELRYHERTDPHRPGSRLVEVILGGQDGLVNVLELAAIGLCSALAGYGIGALFGA